jgi:hypothetical protein
MMASQRASPRIGRSAFRAASISRCSAPGSRTASRSSPARWPRGKGAAAGRGDAPGAVPRAEDFRAHEARVCIAEGNALGDRRRPKLFTPEQYLKSPQEMARLFADVPQAIENACEIARRCNLEIDLGKNRLPEFPDPGRRHVDEHSRAEAGEGLEGGSSGCFAIRRRASAKRRATASVSRSRSRPSCRWALRATS